MSNPHLTRARLPLTAATLAALACLAALVAAMLPPGGHPPLSDYIAAFAVPAAWAFGAVGLGSAVLPRRPADKQHRSFAIAANLAAIVAASGLWFFWPAMRAA